MKPAIAIFKAYQYWVLMFSTVLFLNGCCKAFVSQTTYLKNNTNNKIELTIYENGINRSAIVPKSEIIEAPFEITFIKGDSIIVFVNDAMSAIHYPKNNSSTVVNPKVIRASDPGSLFNPNNYIIEKTHLKCDGSITKSTYVFEN